MDIAERNKNLMYEFKKTHFLKSLYIRFNKETFLDDILNCSSCRTNIPNTYVHEITKDGVNICDIQTSWHDKTVSSESIVDYDLSVRAEK